LGSSARTWLPEPTTSSPSVNSTNHVPALWKAARLEPQARTTDPNRVSVVCIAIVPQLGRLILEFDREGETCQIASYAQWHMRFWPLCGGFIIPWAHTMR